MVRITTPRSIREKHHTPSSAQSTEAYSPPVGPDEAELDREARDANSSWAYPTTSTSNSRVLARSTTQRDVDGTKLVTVTSPRIRSHIKASPTAQGKPMTDP